MAVNFDKTIVESEENSSGKSMHLHRLQTEPNERQTESQANPFLQLQTDQPFMLTTNANRLSQSSSIATSPGNREEDQGLGKESLIKFVRA